jgi:hypothetical protein
MAIERIKVLNYQELGKKFIQWALDPASRPVDLDGFKAQTVGIVEQPLPDYITEFKLVQAANKSQLLLRVPPAELVQDTLTEIAGPGDYRLPEFYEEKFLHGQHSPKREFFELRVGDYLIAHCS